MNLLGLNTAELEELMREMGEGAFRGRQIGEWIYRRGATSFEDMTNLSRDLRARLQAEHEITFPPIAARHESADGSTKLLLQMSDAERIETVRSALPATSERVRFVAGRLRDGLRFLRHRTWRFSAQFKCGRNYRTATFGNAE